VSQHVVQNQVEIVTSEKYLDVCKRQLLQFEEIRDFIKEHETNNILLNISKYFVLKYIDRRITQCEWMCDFFSSIRGSSVAYIGLEK